jgi:hypothetical protein
MSSTQANAPVKTRNRGRVPGSKRYKLGLTELDGLAAQHAQSALETVVLLLKTSSDEKVKLAAAREILDRAYGKPAQAVTADHTGILTIRWLGDVDDA